MAIGSKNSPFEHKNVIFNPPMNKKTLLQTINFNSKDNTEISTKVPIVFRRFKVKNCHFCKNSSSLSPVNKSPSEKTTIKNDKFDFSKIKKTKETSQERKSDYSIYIIN